MGRSVLAVALTGVLLLATAAVPAVAAPGGSESRSAAAGAVGASTVDTLVFGTSYSPTTGASGGTLAVGDWQYPETLNPYFAWSTAGLTAAAAMLRGCAAVTSDGKYVPDLCASLPSEATGDVVVTGSTFTVAVHLRPNLQWSDGQPLTMNDLRYTWQWATDPAQVACINCSVWWNVSAIDVSADGLTATMHFSQRSDVWLSLLTNAILPEHYLSALPIAEAETNAYPAGPAVFAAPASGPFKVAGLTTTEIDYVRNDRFAAGLAPTHTGGAYLQNLVFKYFVDQAAEIDALGNGTIDLAVDLDASSYAALKNIPTNVASAVVAPTRSYEHLELNNDPTHARKNGLWDVNVRKAIATAISKQAMAAVGVPGVSVAIPCVPVGTNAWYAKPERCPAYSPSAAQALLTKAGWKVDAKGWVAKAGREMNLSICTTQRSSRVAEAKALQAALKKVHIKSAVRLVPSSVLYGSWSETSASTACTLAHGTFDIAVFTYMIPLAPASLFGFYKSSQWPEQGDHYGFNNSRFKSAKMDAAVAALAEDVTLASQLADAATAQDAHVAGIPEVALYYVPAIAEVGVHVGNWVGAAVDGVATWNVSDWFYKP
jgi:peptide/nickel transport system substrate-binding protein